MLICVFKPKISRVSLVGVVSLLLPPPLEQTLKDLCVLSGHLPILSYNPTPAAWTWEGKGQTD